MLDISRIYKDIQHLKLQKYNNPFPTLFITAQDPDDACFLILANLIKIIINQDPSIHSRILCQRLKKVCKIDKIYILN